MNILSKLVLLSSLTSSIAAYAVVNQNFPNGKPKGAFQICLEQKLEDGLHISVANNRCKHLLSSDLIGLNDKAAPKNRELAENQKAQLREEFKTATNLRKDEIRLRLAALNRQYPAVQFAEALDTTGAAK